MEVQIISGTPGNHINERRLVDYTVLDKVLLLHFLPKHFIVMTFPRKTVHSRMSVENHYHPESSEREELFVFLGKIFKEEMKDPPEAAIFKFRKAGEPEIKEVILKVGDACLVPSGYSHAFLPLRNSLCVIGISNKPFSREDEDTVIDELF